MIVLDIETTGVNPQKHGIVSIGAIEFEEPGNEFYGECRIFDGAHISEEALEVNHFTHDDITDPTKQSPEVLMRAFLKWSREVEERTLCGLNIGGFDLQFIVATAHRHGLNFDFAYRTLDLHTMSYMHMVKSGIDIPTHNKHTAIDLEETLSYVGLQNIDVPHNALGDAKLEGECVSRLLYGENLFEEFAQYPIPWKNLN